MFFGVLLSGLESRGGKTRLSGQTPTADIRLVEFSLREQEGGKPKFQIYAREAEYFEGENQIELLEVQGTFMTREGQEVIFRAARGRVDSLTLNVILESGEKGLEGEEKGLEIRLSNGFTIDAKRLEWDAGKQKLTSLDPVKLSGQGVVIRGEDFRGDLDKQIFSLNKNAHLTVLY